MNKNAKTSRFFSWLDRVGEAADFVSIDHLNLTNLSRPPLDYETKYSTRPDKNDY
ncbi:hypothetical protein NBE98_12890 [Clostridium swellfunianum]|uniref:hypothetical protein n=1 Tax=Clostridium swellfunianum TaxID=1367462 RepID=UPI00202DD19A|nr:hypothetical protein [Clostridium swellfunianum]MCM0649268.1 hypothetical protein [Clostridium swellfunianum]